MDWLVTTFIAALLATILRALLRGRYRLGFLTLMLWGATLMILVDHIMGYAGGPFFQAHTDGLISSGALLGVLMLVPVVGLWLGALLRDRLRRKGG